MARMGEDAAWRIIRVEASIYDRQNADPQRFRHAFPTWEQVQAVIQSLDASGARTW